MSRMLDEAREAPEAVARQLRQDRERWRAFGEGLRRQPPSSLLTIARGSSDHAAHYAAYLIMARLGRLVTSMPMSLVTLYQSEIRCEGLASFAFSQSGQSPDLVGPTRYFRERGAVTCAFVNDPDSPLAQAAQWLFCLHAGQERSVAATKSFIAQLVAGARLVASWQDDAALAAALEDLPRALQRAAATDWSPAVGPLRQADRLFVVGRGLGLPVAMEAALKFKETCGIQAEAFSGRRDPARADGADRRGLSRCWCSPRAGPRRPACSNWRRRCASGVPACCWRRRRARRQPTCRWWKARCPSSTRCARSRASTPWWRRSRARAATIPTARRT